MSSELCRARTNLNESNDQLHAARREIENVSSSCKEQAIHIHDLELRLHQTTQERRRYCLFRSTKSYGAKYIILCGNRDKTSSNEMFFI